VRSRRAPRRPPAVAVRRYRYAHRALIRSQAMRWQMPLRGCAKAAYDAKRSGIGFSALACAAASLSQPTWVLAGRRKTSAAVVGLVLAGALSPEPAD